MLIFSEAGGAPAWDDAPAGGGRSGWWSAGAFDEATRRAAGRLRGAGLSPGDRVLWATGSSIASLVAHVGALRAGLVVVPANVALTERELVYLLADARPRAAILERPRQSAWARVAAEGLVVTGPELDLPDAPCDAIDEALPEDPALLCYTSGTTGTPKGAVLRHRHLLAATESVRLAWRWSPEDRLVHSLPIFHAHGLCVGVYGTLLAGSSAVLLPSFDPGAVVEAAERNRASLFFGVPTMYHRILRAGVAGELSGLRLCVSGSAPLPRELFEGVRAASGQRVLERYGMTETLMNVSNPCDGERRPGTVGFPLPCVDVVLAQDAEILVRGPNVFDGYWERPSETAEAFGTDDTGSSWFHTGDLGEDRDGYLVIRGRSKELIISGGYNIYPAEVEDVLRNHPSIIDVAVTGTASAEWGEVVTAWVVTDGPVPTVEELAAFTAPLLAAYKRPRLVRSVDMVPRNALGKVVRAALGS